MSRSADEIMSSLFTSVDQKSREGGFAELIESSKSAYKSKFGAPMTDMRQAILKSSLSNYADSLISNGKSTRSSITSAVSDMSKVDNPLTFLFSLFSIVIPNLTYMDVIGVQPMPSKKSPVFFPQITANTARNGVAIGDKLLGATNWNTNNFYSTNRNSATGVFAATASGSDATITVGTTNLKKKTVSLTIKIGSLVKTVVDNGDGTFTSATGLFSAGAINYATGVITLTAATAYAVTDKWTVDFRYDQTDGYQVPAQATLKWDSVDVEAEPYRLRSVYELDDFYQAKKLLKDYNIDAVLSSSLGGLINKDISCQVLDDIYDQAEASISWNGTAPTGVAWALHRLSAINAFIEARNEIRANVKRSEGNKLIVGTKWATLLEGLGDDVWEPKKYASTPIGPYVSGKLLGTIDVIKNQDSYDAGSSVITYKASDLDAAFMGGVYLALYATQPKDMDDLKVYQGMGTQFGYQKVITNSAETIEYVEN